MKTRSFLTLSFMFIFGLLMMYIGTGLQYNVQAALFFWIVFSLIASTIVWGLWNLELRVRDRQSSSEKINSTEKRKRERLDSVLRDLSDEDLLRLRRRLLDGTISDEHLEAELLDSDGELHYRERR